MNKYLDNNNIKNVKIKNIQFYDAAGLFKVPLCLSKIFVCESKVSLSKMCLDDDNFDVLCDNKIILPKEYYINETKYVRFDIDLNSEDSKILIANKSSDINILKFGLFGEAIDFGLTSFKCTLNVSDVDKFNEVCDSNLIDRLNDYASLNSAIIYYCKKYNFLKLFDNVDNISIIKTYSNAELYNINEIASGVLTLGIPQKPTRFVYISILDNGSIKFCLDDIAYVGIGLNWYDMFNVDYIQFNSDGLEFYKGESKIYFPFGNIYFFKTKQDPLSFDLSNLYSTEDLVDDIQIYANLDYLIYDGVVYEKVNYSSKRL